MAKDDKKIKNSDLVRMGRIMRDFAEFGISRRELLWISFLRGLAQGLGAVIGGTILIALLVWLLGYFNEIPFLGDAVDAITDTMRGD